MADPHEAQGEPTISPELTRDEWMEILESIDTARQVASSDPHNPMLRMKSQFLRGLRGKLAEQIVPQSKPQHQEIEADGTSEEEEG